MRQGTAFLGHAMAGVAGDSAGGRPSDDRRRRWFLQDFAATTLADESMDLRLAADCIQHMERELGARHGVVLDRFMFYCWDQTAQAHFDALFRSTFGQPFMHNALQNALQEDSDSEPEFSEASSQPEDGQRTDHMEDQEEHEEDTDDAEAPVAGGANMPSDHEDLEASSEDSERRWHRLHQDDSDWEFSASSASIMGHEEPADPAPVRHQDGGLHLTWASAGIREASAPAAWRPPSAPSRRTGQIQARPGQS